MPVKEKTAAIESNAALEQLKGDALKKLFDNLRDGVFLVHDGRLVAANKPLYSILSLPEDKELSLQDLFVRLNNTENATARGNLKRLLTGKPFGPIQIKIDIGNLRFKTIELHYLSIVIDGKYYTQGTVVDLTREYEVESELFETLTLLNSMFDAIDDAILILDNPEMTLRSSNVAAGRIFKVDRGALKGNELWSLLADRSQSKYILEQVKDKLPSSGRIHFDLDMKRGDGSTFPALHTITNVFDSSGKNVALMWIVSDMSKQTYLNRALAEVETRYRLLFDRAADATFIIDANTHKIIDANYAAEVQLGFSRAELIGLDMLDITPPERHGSLTNDIKKLETDGGSTIMGINVSSDGRQIPVEISSVMTTFGNRRVYMMACRDMTHQLERQKERLQLETLESVRQVAGGIAHEFSQPLQGLMTIADIIATDAGSLERHRDIILQIPPLIDRMSILLNQMQRIVRLASRPYTSSNIILDLGQSVKLPFVLLVGFSADEAELAVRVAKVRSFEPIVIGNIDEAMSIFDDVQPECVVIREDMEEAQKSLKHRIKRTLANTRVVSVHRQSGESELRESDIIAAFDEAEQM